MSEQTVTTAYGKVAGSSDDDVVAYLGIPYAAPPVGPLRLRAPVPPDAWSGVFSATQFGAIAAQPNFGLGSYVPGDPIEQSEDCLTLNIWAPAAALSSLPVMVFLHGGSFLTGSGSGVMYRGEHLARRRVIVVTLNYRLGVFGFLAHRELSQGEELVGNFGLADQLAALRWVRENIVAFGGDPHNVTCFGQSAGAMSIADLFAAPSARGLFHRAVLQSGAEVVDRLSDAELLAERFAKELGIAQLTREALQAIPVAEVMAAQVAAGAQRGEFLSFKPVIDGKLITEHPAVSLVNGSSSSTELLIGTNRDEFKFFTFSAKEVADLDETGLVEIVEQYTNQRGSLRQSAHQVIDVYRRSRAARAESTRPRDLLDAIAADAIFRLPLERLAQAHVSNGGRCYFYRFDWTSPFGDGGLGACHGLELPFVFGTVDNPVIAMFAGGGTDAEALSDRLQTSWVSFATCGDPTNDRVGSWPVFDEATRSTMIFNDVTRLEDLPDRLERQFWVEHLPRYGEVEHV